MSRNADIARASDVDPSHVQTLHVAGKSDNFRRRSIAGDGSSNGSGSGHGIPELLVDGERENEHGIHEDVGRAGRQRQWFGYLKTKQFWIVLVAGQILSLLVTGTNTLSQLLASGGANIPAFQTFFNYVLMAFVWSGITIFKLGFKGWLNMIYKRGWKYLILAFFDVEGNYFTVLGYRYTTILSMQLINFWAIVVVVVLSFCFLKVRYNLFQIAGILVCVGGVGVLIGSDHITKVNDFPAENPLKGDLFALLGATCYGVANTLQEVLVSEAPIYEVVGQMGVFGMLINGVQAAIFDREAFRAAQQVYSAKIGGYIVGFDLLLFCFYSLAPIIFRMGSAAFLNISLLTSNFWGTIVGVHVFGLRIHFLYPIAFVLIIVGLVVYFVMEGSWGDSFKPWLGRNQEKGVAGIGTAKRRIERPDAVV